MLPNLHNLYFPSQKSFKPAENKTKIFREIKRTRQIKIEEVVFIQLLKQINSLRCEYQGVKI